MKYMYIPYIWPFIATIIVNVLMIFYVLKNRRRNGVTAFIITLLFSTLWCLGTIMEMSSANLETKLFWAKAAYPAYTFGPLAWTIMVMQVTDWRHLISRKRILLLCIIPTITVLLVWTNDFHGLIWNHISINTHTKPYRLIHNHGLWFWVHAFYSDGLNILSIIIPIEFCKRKAPLYGKQFKYLSYSMIFIILVNAIYVLRIGPPIDTTSIAWGISSLFITGSLFRKNLFNLVPIARNKVMESMTDGIVVLDLMNRIVDMNPSALSIFHCEPIKNIGCGALDFFEDWPALSGLIIGDKAYVEFEYKLNEKYQYYETSCLPVKNETEDLLGKFLVLHDVTEKRIVEKKLFEKQREAAKIEERESMARDLHDNLGQILGFVNVQAQAIGEYLKHDQLETAVLCLERLTEVAQEAHNEVRETILSMRSQSVVKVKKTADFFIELQRQINSFERNYCINIELDYNEFDVTKLYNSKVMVQVLYIIKESLNNIIKHSGASIVKIKFEKNVEWMIISVTDNGCGFNIENTLSKPINTYGLLSMKERTEEICGVLNLHSDIGKGTTINLKIPNQLEKEDSFED